MKSKSTTIIDNSSNKKNGSDRVRRTIIGILSCFATVLMLAIAQNMSSNITDNNDNNNRSTTPTETNRWQAQVNHLQLRRAGWLRRLSVRGDPITKNSKENEEDTTSNSAAKTTTAATADSEDGFDLVIIPNTKKQFLELFGEHMDTKADLEAWKMKEAQRQQRD